MLHRRQTTRNQYSYRSVYLFYGLLILFLGTATISINDHTQSFTTALASSPDASLPQAYDVEIPILAYHKVDETALNTWYVTVDQFAAQMDVLSAYGYQSVSLSDYLEYYNGTTPPPEKPVIVTFDDGYQGVYDYAYPILAERDMEATVFILTGYTGEAEEERFRNSWNPSEPTTFHMIWPEVATMYEAGFSIGSHTVTHPNLLDLTEPEALYEISHSFQDIQAHLESNTTMGFAYPYGNGASSTLIRDLVQQSGYSAAVAFGGDDGIANPAVSDLWALPRRSIIKGVSLELNNDNPWYFFMRRIDPDFPLPNIGMDDFVVLDSAGNERYQYYPGESLTFTLEAYNWGNPTDVKATLEITSTDSTLYNSHWMSPTKDIVVQPFSYYWEPTEFTYNIAITQTAVFGEYTYSFNIFDNFYLLNYYRKDVQPAFSVVESPISVKTNVDSFDLHGNEPFDLWFTVGNTGNPAEEMFLTVSLSHGLKVISTYPETNWAYYPIGSEVKVKDCLVDCPLSTFAIYEAIEADYGSGKRSYRITVQSITGSTENEWIQYRLTMRLPDGQLTPDWYLRNPLAGGVDQQGWAAWSMPITVYRNDLFIPFITKQ
jgi:peptidoglycan/xylan/chitin deacetylase (PgdA/CDA1 family)